MLGGVPTTYEVFWSVTFVWVGNPSTRTLVSQKLAPAAPLKLVPAAHWAGPYSLRIFFLAGLQQSGSKTRLSLFRATESVGNEFE